MPGQHRSFPAYPPKNPRNSSRAFAQVMGSYAILKANPFYKISLMKNNAASFLSRVGLGFIALLSACQSGPTSGPVLSAITCDKCRTVWIQRAERASTFRGSAGPYVLKSESRMVCPDCESTAQTFFKTGRLKHDCKHCGGTMSDCTEH